MKDKDKIIKTAIGSLVALATVGTTIVSTNAIAAGEQEKCYGVIKAGMNDCATANSSCAGSATKDSQPDAWAFMPKGLCEKIVGASTSPITTANTTTPAMDNAPENKATTPTTPTETPTS